MPGFSSYDDLISEGTQNGKVLEWNFSKVGGTMQGGLWHSLWASPGTPGAAAYTSGAKTNEAGSITFADTSTDQTHLVSFGAASTLGGTLMLYDRLASIAGVSMASTGSKTVGTATLPRYTSGIDVQAWLEVTTQIVGTFPIVSLSSYTDDDGNAAQTSTDTVTYPAATTIRVGTMLQLPILAGDKGVRAVANINVATAATTAVASVVLLKPLATVPLYAAYWNDRDCVQQIVSLPRIYDGASLGLMWLPTATTAVTVYGSVRAFYG